MSLNAIGAYVLRTQIRIFILTTDDDDVAFAKLTYFCEIHSNPCHEGLNKSYRIHKITERCSEGSELCDRIYKTTL